MPTDAIEVQLARIDERLTAIEGGVLPRLKSIEDTILTLRLHEARLEPFERAMWFVLAAILAAVGGGLWTLIQQGALR